MSGIIRAFGGTVTRFDPKNALQREAEANAIKKYAIAVKNWDTLNDAVEQQIFDQRDLVAWWDANVGVRLRAGRGEISADRRSFMSLAKAEKLTGFEHQQISRFRKRLNDIPAYRELLRGPSYRKAMGKDANTGTNWNQSHSNEHYTPIEYIEAARGVLGEIDLDPASCALANETVKAANYFSQQGEEEQWSGRVWLNPPYGGLAGVFVKKLVDEFRAGNVESAIVLVSAHCTDTSWFQFLWDGVLCFTNHRISFSGDANVGGSVFVYFGKDRDAFINQFGKYGVLVERVR